MGVRDIAKSFLGRGGKRLRPRLCASVFRACGGDANAPGLALLETAIECFHKASLIHDDIQDGDEVRYGKPSVWKEHGVALAIAAGDWLVAYGYGLIAQSGFQNAATMLQAATASHLLLCEGQGDDLLTPSETSDTETYLSICTRKTGEAFALAAELGALAAGADPTPYRDWACLWGTLFQIRDDLADGDRTKQLTRLEEEWRLRAEAACPPQLKNWPL